MSDGEPDITDLLQRWSQGDGEAFKRLVDRVYPALRKIASRRLRGGGARLEMQTTELVHDAYLRLVDQTRTSWSDRRHFFKLAATVMRRVVVDQARRRTSLKRGGEAETILLDDTVAAEIPEPPDWLELDVCLDRLGDVDPQARQLVELRFFVGLSIDEAAETLEIGRTTAVRKWRVAKAWLREHWQG